MSSNEDTTQHGCEPNAHDDEHDDDRACAEAPGGRRGEEASHIPRINTEASNIPEIKPISGFAAATARKIAKAKQRREEFYVALTENDGWIRQTQELLGVNKKTYDYWRKIDPVWAARVDALRAHFRNGDSIATGPRTFQEHRLRYFQRDTLPHQGQMVQILNNAQDRHVYLILIHPEAGKTATLEDWLCKEIDENPDVRISYATESTDLAKKVLGFVKARMTEPDWIQWQSERGPFYTERQEREGRPWTTTHITVSRASFKERDYTFQCRAILKSHAYGSRIDKLIGDDIQSRETYTQTDAIFSHLRQTYFTRGKRMTMIFVGTRIGPGDVYERMIEEFGDEDWFHVISLTAAVGDEPNVPEAWADPADYPTHEEFLAAARYNLARIRKQVGEEVWWASYQQSPRSSSLASFQNIDMAKDNQRVIGRCEGVMHLSLDPALSGMNALLATAFTPQTLYVCDLQADVDMGTNEAIMEGVRVMAMRYHPSYVIIEQNAFQKGLVLDVRWYRLARELGFQIVPHQTGREKNDVNWGVGAMAGPFNAGVIRIPWGDELTRTRLGPLVHQLDAWRPGISAKVIKQDAVMALWFAWKRWKEWQTTLERSVEHTLWRPSWMSAG